MQGFQPGRPNEFIDNAIEGNNFVNAYLENKESNDMGVDGSSSPVIFSYIAPKCITVIIGRLLLYMEANSVFHSGKFMNLNALSNGVKIYVNDSLLTTWKTNIDIVSDMFDTVGGLVFSESGKVLRCRWSFYKACNRSSGILIRNGGSISAVINDNLSVAGIVFRCKVQGIEIPPI